MYDDHLDELYESPGIALIGETGLDNIVSQIRYIHDTTDGDAAIDRARFSLRLIACILPEDQNDALTVAYVCGFMGANTMSFVQALTATGRYSGEMGFEKLKAFLIQVVAMGQNPTTLAKSLRISDDEYRTLEHLLGLQQHWRETVPDRVFLAVLSGEGIAEIRRIANCGYWAARRWRAWARGAKKQLGIIFDED